MHNILVVDDDPTVAEVVTGYLERAGYTVARAADGPGALEAAGERWPDLVVLDLMLPGMDGLEVCRRLRGRGPVPVIMLTARGDEDDRILGLETGADDYVTKPFSPRELVLRVECVLRRGRSAADAAPGGPVLSCAGITVDPAARRVTKDGAEIGLTLREFDLLLHLMRYRGLAIGRERLMQEVWGWDFGDLSTVTVHVRRLRGKIEDDPARPRLIHTVWGVGYRFDAPAEPERQPVPTLGDAPDAPVDPEGPAPGDGGARPPRPYDRTAAPEPDDRTTSAERPDARKAGGLHGSAPGGQAGPGVGGGDGPRFGGLDAPGLGGGDVADGGAALVDGA
ncbi:response regulator transcription factor [Streptomyces sp. NPDC096153]|uniref:response regulator transcription factor n=1 Tax=Streptomyces sp. NPDC096153 TaxID=3155548 RepID=UPI00332C9EE2